jgi:hypothetical protein
VAEQIYFNCGEFRPGQEPIIIPPLEPVTPAILIPAGTYQNRPRLPQYPTSSPFIKIPRIRNPSSVDPPINRQRNPRPNTGGSSSGTGSSGAGDPTGNSGNNRGPTTGFEQRYRCTSVKIYCPEDLHLPEEQRRIVRIKRFCVLCTPEKNESGQFEWPPDCIYTSKPQCESVCKDSNTQNNCVEPNGSVIVSPQIDPTGETSVINQNQASSINVQLEYGRISQNTQRRAIEINIESYLSSSVNRVTTSAGGEGRPVLYNEELNFFSHNPSNNTNLIENLRYTQIFARQIPIELNYLLNKVNSTSEWSEVPVQELTLEKLALGLNRELLEAFKIIHHVGNTPVGLNDFLEAIRKHVLTGTIDEIDPQYYKDLARRQKEDTVIQYTGLQVQEYRERAALGLIASRARPIDSNDLKSIQLRQLRRQRRLNEDVNARIPVCPIDNEDGYLRIENAGICLTKSDTTSDFLQNGKGDGYYFNLDNLTEGCIVFRPLDNVSSAYFVPHDVRFNALNIIGEDAGSYIRSESTNSHEFSVAGEGDEALVNDLELEPLYFMLELSSVSSVLTSNPLIDRFQGTYRLSRNQSEIDEHTDNNGFSVTRVNLDYRDPLYRYIRSSSSFTFEQNDITFRGFEDSEGIINRTTLVRNVPFGIVVTPVMGSKFNPFNGASRIEQLGNTITRSIRLIPDINRDHTIDRNVLQEVNLLDVSSGGRIGIYEPLDSQNITYRFYSSAANLNTNYYSGGYYISSIDTPSSHGAGYLIRNVIDGIISEHDPETITWYDVYRRMSLNRFGELLYDGSEYLYQKLSNGFRDNVKIKHVLAKRDESVHPVLEDDSLVVISRLNRSNATNYKTR